MSNWNACTICIALTSVFNAIPVNYKIAKLSSVFMFVVNIVIVGWRGRLPRKTIRRTQRQIHRNGNLGWEQISVKSNSRPKAHKTWIICMSYSINEIQTSTCRFWFRNKSVENVVTSPFDLKNVPAFLVGIRSQPRQIFQACCCCCFFIYSSHPLWAYGRLHRYVWFYMINEQYIHWVNYIEFS